MNRSTNARRLSSALLVALAVMGWILIERYTTPASPLRSESLVLHWGAMALYFGVIFGTIILALVIAFWNRIQRTGLLIHAWNLAVAVGLIVLYFITSDPVARLGLKEVGLGALPWIFLASGIVSLATSFLLFGSFVDVRQAGAEQRRTS